MKKMFTALLTVIVMCGLFSFTAFAATAEIEYYDENGNAIVVNGLYYNRDGLPMYNANCYYLNADDNAVYVGGCRAYYYNQNGDLTAGSYYYDHNGQAITRPASYPGGYGCGMWYYDAQGGVVNQTTYYDDFGNEIEPPVTAQPYAGHCGNGYGGGCHGWR